MDNIKKLFYKYKEAVSYLFFGGLTTVVNWSSYGILVKYFDLNFNIANALSWVFAVLFAFVTNKLWVFESKKWGKDSFVKEFLPFVASRAVTGFFEVVSLPFAVKIGLNQSFMGVENFIAKMTVSVIVVIANYILSKFIIFKDFNDVLK